MAFWSENFASGGKDPKRKFRFIVSFGNIATPEGGPILWFAKTASKPSFQLGETTHDFLNHKFKYPGRVAWQDVTVTLVDPADPDVAATLSDIVVAAGYSPPTNAYDLESMSKHSAVSALGTVTVSQLDDKGTPIETWTLWNAFISELKYGDLDYAGDDLTEVSVTLKYDWARLETASESRSIHAGGKEFFKP